MRQRRSNSTAPRPRGSVFQLIVDTIGMDSALKLMHGGGGIEVYIPLPQHVHKEHWTARAVGLSTARSLAKKLADEGYAGRVHLPTGNNNRRHLAILSALADGKSVRETAQLLHLHERTVRRHRPAPPKSPRRAKLPARAQPGA